LILVFGIVVEGSSLRVALKEINELNTENQAILTFLRESRHSEILIIFTEDFCAVIGLGLAAIGTVATMLTNNPMFDALSGLLIGLLLTGAAIFLAREFYSLIVGESVTASDLKKIMLAFNRADVERLIDIKTIHLGPDEIMIAAKIDLLDTQEARGYAIINEIEAAIRQELAGKKAYIYIETDKYDPNYYRE
jgi:divalent metal cation (Fe/Co/Zn/Cd) transporter